ncbi:MAG: hypothetical protein GY841_08715, partial [FCB group bacterium]|nr:hypothetical protein [FCB group bacterium]
MIRVVLGLFLIFLLSLPVFGQVYDDDEELDSYILAIGLTSPVTPEFFRANWNYGFHFMAGIGFAVSPSVDVIPKFEFHRLGFNQGQYRADPVNLYLFGIDFRPMALIRGTGRMFLIGGIGFSRTEIPDIIGSGKLAQAGDLQMNLYINFGGGLEFKITRKL